MSLETAQKCLDLALETVPAEKSLNLCFFGGEPLLRFDLVRKITAYTYQKAAALNKSVRLSITTNGTLVTPEVIDFAADQNLHLCFSLDGPQDLHDRNRIFHNGRGSFASVMARLELALKRLNTVQVNAVLGQSSGFTGICQYLEARSIF